MTDLRRYTKPVAGTSETLVAERPEWTPRGLMARMSLWGTEMMPGGNVEDRVFFLGVVNLTSVQERLTFQRLLTGMMAHAWTDEHGNDKHADFEPQLLWDMAEFFSAILHGESQNSLPVVLGQSDAIPQMVTPLHQIGDCSLLAAHPTIFFGEGESGKSYVWAYLVGQLAFSGVNVLVLDYELDEADHTDRLRRMFGDVPPLHYLKCATPLPELVPLVRDYAVTHGIHYLVVDSIAPACGAEAEASETANRYFTALKDIGIAGSLHIAHRAKTSYDRKGEEKPFGSSFWHNLARETYLLAVDERTPDTRGLTISCRKANLRAYPPDVKVTLTFEDSASPHVDVRTEVTTPAGMDEGQAAKVRALTILALATGPMPFETWRKRTALPKVNGRDQFYPLSQLLAAEGLASKEVKTETLWQITPAGKQLLLG